MLKSIKLPRKPELDALRGLFLVWMTLTHLPTRMSDMVNQPFGFVSSAEGFVFLSALLISRIYLRQAAEDIQGLRVKLWRRALRIYGYHVLLLVLAFTLAAAFAVLTHRAALLNLLDFYFAHPAVAVVGSLLLIYCPPLLDILPMYVLFLLLSPLVLYVATRRGWRPILIASWSVWLLAQFGLRAVAHSFVVHLTHLPIPLQQTGAFDLFAWQWIWIMGMWLGARSAQGELPLARVPDWLNGVFVVVCIFFIGVRHEWWGHAFTPETFGMLLDKWQIGPLRVLNLIAVVSLLYGVRRYIKKLVAREPFITLGKASLEVFCAHLVFVFVGLALLYGQIQQLHGAYALALLAITFAGLILIASREVHRKQQSRKHSSVHTPTFPANAFSAPPEEPALAAIAATSSATALPDAAALVESEPPLHVTSCT
jgi:hypothetical protein